jgi:hypothetical protein
VAAGLRIFWLPLVLSERIERLVLAGQRVLLLQNSGLDGGSVNETNFVLSRAAITIRREQRKYQSENVWYFQRGESSGLSGNPVTTCSSELHWSCHTSLAALNCRRLPGNQMIWPCA